VAELSPPLDAIAVPPELVEGIADEAAWHDDARAEPKQPAAEVTEEPVETEQRAPEPPVRAEDAEPAPEPETEPEPAARTGT
jgi:hypothetical protein